MVRNINEPNIKIIKNIFAHIDFGNRIKSMPMPMRIKSCTVTDLMMPFTGDHMHNIFSAITINITIKRIYQTSLRNGCKSFSIDVYGRPGGTTKQKYVE